MFDRFLRSLLVLALVGGSMISSAPADDRAASQPLREEMWALMTPLPMFAYVVRPVANCWLDGGMTARGARCGAKL